MKIRIMGTMDELKAAEVHFLWLRGNDGVQSVEISEPYKNRPPSALYRLYIEVIYNKPGTYQQRYSEDGPWYDVPEFSVKSAMTCNGDDWAPIAARLIAGETIKTRFSEYRQLKRA